MHERAITHDLGGFISKLDKDPQHILTATSLKEVFQSSQFIRRIVGSWRRDSINSYNTLVAGKMIIFNEKAEVCPVWLLPDYIDTVELLREKDPFTVIIERLQSIQTDDIKSELLEQAINTAATEGLQTIGGIFLLSDSIHERVEIAIPRAIAERFGGVTKPTRIIASLIDATKDFPDFECVREDLRNYADPDRYHPGRYPFNN